MEKKTYTSEFKVKVVLESLQRDTTVEAVCQKFGVSRSQLWRWRQEFQERAPDLFAVQTQPKRESDQPGLRAR